MKILVLFLLISACTSNSSKFKRFDIDELGYNIGHVKYILSNQNYKNICKNIDSSNFRNLKLDILNKDLFLNYKKGILFQVYFNQRISDLFKIKNVNFIPLSREQFEFYKGSDLIHAGRYSVSIPTYKRINLIWVENIINKKNIIKRLKKLLKSKDMNNGFPVLVSSCHSKYDLEKFFNSLNLDVAFNPTFISFDFFSFYNSRYELTNKRYLDIQKLFNNSQKLYLYSSKKSLPINIKSDSLHKKIY